jgi:hypothetical protein
MNMSEKNEHVILQKAKQGSVKDKPQKVEISH